MNHIQMFEGNITRDPESRFTASGTQLATFGIAVNDRGRDDGDERTIFWNVTAFKGLAENVIASVKKGDRVVVLGRVRSWTREIRDEEGQTRNVASYGIDAVDVAVSLMWATAEPVKASRSGRADTNGRAGGNAAAGTPPAAPAAYGPDEEPF